jgi:amino acid adenylation domain-containing protein
MSDRSTNLAPEQQAIRDKCFQPSGTFVEFPIEDVETSIPARFEKMVRMYPDRIAVKTESRVATYNDLNDMANRFARALLQSQSPRAQIVALLLEKDVAQVAAMLGAMKAGKFFLILDPSFPKTRLAAMLEGSRTKLVVTNRRNALLADEITTPDCQLMQWETVDNSISEDNPELSIAPKALAFVNYTSGSTGEPKGLLRTHRMILHNIMLRTNLIHVSEHDRISLLSSGTSNAITNSLVALLNGAGLYSLDVKKEGVVRLARWLAEESITIAPMSSPLFRGLCETLNGNNNFPNLRVIRLRSEAVYKSDADLYKQYFSPNCIFVTGLSSNETGPLADYLIDHDTVLIDSAVPVGYVASGKEVLLLNHDGEKIGFNEVGEIAVRSRYLSPGYLRNPRLAKAKFKRDLSENGNRIYLTGDMGLMLSNACLVYKGRKDFRVKVRGYPVDLKEVETALRAHPSISDSVITARSNRSGETVLVAYFVTAYQQVPTVSELLRFLGQTLPDYMIPAAFVRLNSLPLNPQNKVDRAALPPPAETRPNLEIPLMAPRGDEEKEVAEIWAEVLGIDRVGIHDNFFDLGGHSLSATRIVTRVIDKFQFELPLQVLFDSPTVEKMAAVITANQSVGHKPGELRSRRSGDALPAHSVEPTIDFTPFPKEDLERSIPARFEKIVRLYPDRIAVKTGNEVVTYSQLNATANRLARRIVSERGAGPEPVGLLIDKGVEQIAAILGVLKAGKFFVLFDPSFPLGRNSAILEDTSPRLILVDAKNTPYGSKLTNKTSSLIAFESIDPNSVSDDLKVEISPNSLAYVVYTSGSTGKPKGVIQNHRSRLHLVMVYSNMLSLTPNDRSILLTTGTANTIVNSLFALLNGAALHPLNVNDLGLSRLAAWIIDEKISICAISAPLFRKLCESLTGNEKFLDLRVLRLTSEASYKSDFELYKRFFPRTCCLANMLAPTEAGILRQFLMDHDTQINGDEIPLGYPVDDAEIFLLNEEGKEVGCNEVGEIVVRSRYLSPGYWLRPELTEAKFKADPHEANQQFYHTGDLGLMFPDGCLIHKGRKDFRVKIRGYGVETGEVEKVLRGHAAVKDCIVVDRKGESAETKLIAYYTSSPQWVPNASELRKFLSRSLPDYMVPSMFVKLDAIPLTPNGKVDRRALPEPSGGRPELDTPFLAPRTDVEKLVTHIFSECTGIERVGIDDNFFDLGGDSLILTRLLSRLSVTFRREFSMQELFEAPSVAGIACLLESPTQPAAAKIEPLLSPISSDMPLPLSYSQQRLWFLDQLDPGSFTYNLFSAYRLEGDLDVAALEQSFNEIVRRHDVLRTMFKSEDGNPVQVVLPALAIKIPILDLRAPASAEERWVEARRRFTEEAQRPFDLATGPLIRLTLLQLADDEYVLLRAMHHIVSDGWSEGVLFHELSEIYEAISSAKPSPLANLPAQYADYANWQRQWFEGERPESQLSYWRKQLDNIETLQLPTDRPWQALQARRGARRYFAFSDALTSQLKELSTQRRVTLFMTLLGAFQTLLHRYSGQTDIAIGSPVGGRSRRDFENLIGFFLNTLVLRLDLSGNPTFAETIRRVREMCLGALSHQELPFEKLVEEMHPDRNLGQNPLFQVSFAFQNTPRFPLRMSGMTVDELEVEAGIARFDLHLFMKEIDGHLEGYCDYDTNLFNADTIERMVDHFQTLLESIVVDPNQRISDLPLLSVVEKRQLLLQGGDTKTEYPKDSCIHHLFERQVEKTPAAVALVFEDQHLTYRELNSRANQLARYLEKSGIGPDVLVGIYLERSLELVVALLAVLKAGGAYVPLDSSYPQERLLYMLKDSDARILLTSEKLSEQLREYEGQLVCLDQATLRISCESTTNLSNEADVNHLAYVIYTSGSTGNPKGVMIPHRAILNHMVWMLDAFPLNQRDRVVQRTPFGFDASVWEFFAPLIAGAQLVLARSESYRDAEDLVKFLEEEQISILQVVPTLLQMLLDQKLERCTSLRRVFSGGEPLSAELCTRFCRRMTVPLINLYGPTETAIDATFYACSENDSPGWMPIGRPIANAKVFILDNNLGPVPIGIIGEIYIEGDGLARGYINKPELTAEKFIYHSFEGKPVRRLYRTGDLARYLSDGNIECLGRIDNQVKLHGYRIELGEIEVVLGQHPTVQSAVVVVREDTPGDKRLVAYVVARPERSFEAAEIRKYLKQKLPEYMTPSALVLLDELPLTPNGKVDRKALPAPDQGRPELGNVYQAPRTLIEETLASIWSELLKLDQVGIHDNFFELGGHSLLATRLVSRIRQVFHCELPLRTLFEMPTVAGLSNYIEAIRCAGDEHQPAIQEGADQTEEIIL